jgi:hypothetical protein
VNFTNIRYEQNRFILRGITDKATELLETISKLPQVTDAKFDFPTRHSRTGEFFVISFSLKNHQANNEGDMTK